MDVPGIPYQDRKSCTLKSTCRSGSGFACACPLHRDQRKKIDGHDNQQKKPEPGQQGQIFEQSAEYDSQEIRAEVVGCPEGIPERGCEDDPSEKDGQKHDGIGDYIAIDEAKP
jgi:hypothetical protein